MGTLDVLVTHDTSTAVQLAKRSGHAYGKQRFGEREREAIDEILAATTPTWHVDGHHHSWSLFRAEHGGGTGSTTVSLAADAGVELDLTVTPLP